MATWYRQITSHFLFPILLGQIQIALYILSLTVNPTYPYRRALFLFILAVGLYGTFGTSAARSQYHSQLGAHIIGCKFGIMILYSSADILLCNPQRDFRSIPQSVKPISEQPLLSRLRWALEITANPRSINFAHRSQSKLPLRQQRTSNTAFILRQVRRIIIFAMVWEAGTLANVHNPYFHPDVDARLITGTRRLWRLIYALHWIHVVAAMTIAHAMASIVCVSAGLAVNTDWPDLFGSITGAYTVRHFWGVYWHQLFRRPFILHANFFASKLGLPRRGRLQRYSKLLTIFWISALFHLTGDFFASQDSVQSIGTVEFAVLQVLIIVIEDGVLSLARSAGLRETGWTKVLGHVWAFLWFSWSIPFAADIPYRNGRLRDSVIPVSAVQKYLTGSWRPIIPGESRL